MIGLNLQDLMDTTNQLQRNTAKISQESDQKVRANYGFDKC